MSSSGNSVAGTDQAEPEPDRWRRVREYLNGHRYPLATQAAQLHPTSWRVAGTTLLAAPGWIYDCPVDAAEIVSLWRPTAPPAAVTGGEPASRGVRPVNATGMPVDRYSQAMAEFAPPRLFENRRAYRMVEADAARPPDPGALAFATARYFDMVDVCEALAHEFADAMSRERRPGRLPWREYVGDPFDTARRPAVPAICTLVLRRGRGRGQGRSDGDPPRMLLHRRDARGVASGGGLVQVAPVGIFQPSDDGRPDDADELDPWKVTVRELAEELLGRDETYGVPGEPFDYDAWPFYRNLTQARAAGTLKVRWLGIGVDPLTLALDVLQVAVFDAELFDRTLSGMVTANAEGELVGSGTAGVPFTAETVESVTTWEPMQSAGAALLRLALRHRDSLLSDS